MEELKTSDAWYKELYPNKEVRIMDPDGWDRQNFQYSYYEELITQKVFKMRVWTSTCNVFFERKKRNTKLIGVSGKKRSGKNTVANIINKLITEQVNKSYYNDPHWAAPGRKWDDFLQYQEKSFAHLIKVFCSQLTGIPLEEWETEEDKAKFLGPEWDYFDKVNQRWEQMTRRKMLQRFGSDACNANLHPKTWINGLFQDYNEEKSQWLITDVRFPDEVEAIKAKNGIVIRVERPSKNEKDSHISETALDNYKDFDFKIVNNSDLKSLEKKIIYILASLKLIY